MSMWNRTQGTTAKLLRGAMVFVDGTVAGSDMKVKAALKDHLRHLGLLRGLQATGSLTQTFRSPLQQTA